MISPTRSTIQKKERVENFETRSFLKYSDKNNFRLYTQIL